MENLLKLNNAVAAIRVSSVKQGLQGDSPDAQKEQIEKFAAVHNIHVSKFFIFMESASHEEQPVQEAIDYCKNPDNNIQLFIVKSIDRFTRGGSYYYDFLKMQLTKLGVRLVDIYGIVSSQQVNTLDHLDVEFDWSIYEPTKKAEILEAERAKDEIRDILTRMIGAEIRYVRMGYRVCNPPYGYVNEKVETQHGKRVILIPHPEESKWIIRMFELRVRGTFTDRQIVEEINNMGFKSRKHCIRNPQDKTQVIGSSGCKPLDLKTFWRYIESPVYAGISIHKWTKGLPIKGQFAGLVDVETFNQANRGKLVIIEENGEVKIQKRKPKDWQLKKTRKNPNFSYKRYILCDICEKPLFGSSSTGRNGQKYSYYHCNKRGHDFRVSKEELETNIHNFVKSLHITQEYIDTLKGSVLEEWKRRMAETQNDSTDIEKKVEVLQLSTKSITEKIKIVSSEMVIKSLEEDLIKNQHEIKKLLEEKDQKDTDFINMEIVMDNVEYFLENLEDLLLGSPDPIKRAAYFGVLFQVAPTYHELISGNTSLEPCISPNNFFLTNNTQNVS